MDEKKEVKQLMVMARKILTKQLYKKINSVDDIHEKKEVLKFSIKSNLELKFEDLKNKIKKMEQEGKNTFFISLKMSTFKSKIHLFKATFDDSDFIKAMSFFKEIEKEMKNV